MIKKIIFLILAIVIMAPSGVNAEQWRLHPTYDGNVERIIDTPEYTYILSYNQLYIASASDNSTKTTSLFRYDKDENEILWLNKQNLLSDNVVVNAEYNDAGGYLMIAYADGGIELLYDNENTAYVAALKISDGTYSKNVNGISFWFQGNQAFLATDFGYIVVNDKNGEIEYSRVFNKKFNDAIRLGNYIVLVAQDGLYYGDLNERDFNNFTYVDGFRDVYRSVRLSDNSLVVNQIYGWEGEARMLSIDDSGNFRNEVLVNTYIKSIEPSRSGITVASYDKVWNIDKDGNVDRFDKESEDYDMVLASWNLKDYYISRQRDGIAIKRYDGEASWTSLNMNIFPNASNAYKSDNMVYHSKYGMLVRNHGTNQNFQSVEVNALDALSSLRYLTWEPMSTTYLYPSKMFEQWNPNGVSVDPANENHIYSGSYLHGLLRLNTADPSESLRIGKINDEGNIGDQYVAVHPEFERFSMMSFFSAPKFDTYENLWTCWYDYDKSYVNEDCLELWVWSKEDRLASENASNFRPFKKLSISQANVSKSSVVVPLCSSSAKNIVMYSAGNWEGGLIFIDHNGTIDNQGDDTRVDVRSFYDQNGSVVDCYYIKALSEDTSTGRVWVGTDMGVFYFTPAEIMQTGGKVYRIKIARNDGTGLADYLLDGIGVNCIAVDNSGRRWFGTSGGGLVVTSGDGTEILKSYTADNSELPDNTVYAVCYNPDNNSMMISTDKGLAELFLTTNSSSSSSGSDVKAYPNPVRPDYFGYVTIEGLADNALVKIVDAGGNLVKEVGFASGGEIQWDVTNLNNKRVPGGVYYVLASGGADSDSYSARTKILVVN